MEELELAVPTTLLPCSRRCWGRGTQPLPDPTYQLILKPKKVGAAVVTILQHECRVALLQVPPGQRDQRPDLGDKGHLKHKQKSLQLLPPSVVPIPGPQAVPSS